MTFDVMEQALASDQHRHWEDVYARKAATEVSWYEPVAERSLAFIESAAPERSASIIDVGGGASTLVDALVGRGYNDVTVLDIAEAALAQARKRLTPSAPVTWIAADVTVWAPSRRWQVWHDRAVFHFLVERAQQDAYIAALTSATASGSTVIMATFALDGPERCSGLPVQRYSAQSLAARLGGDYRLIAEDRERHRTPTGSHQSFCWAVLERR